MKKAILLKILFFSLLSIAQTKQLKLYDFVLEDQELIWQHVYEVNLDKNDLGSYYINNVISSMKKTNLNQYEDRITFEIKGDKVDFRKNGGKWGNTAVFVQYPENYLVVIDLKDKRYRVTLKSIEIDFGQGGGGISDLVGIVTKKRKTQFGTSSSVIKGLEYIHKHFLEKFDMNRIKKEVDKW